MFPTAAFNNLTFLSNLASKSPQNPDFSVHGPLRLQIFSSLQDPDLPIHRSPSSKTSLAMLPTSRPQKLVAIFYLLVITHLILIAFLAHQNYLVRRQHLIQGVSTNVAPGANIVHLGYVAHIAHVTHDVVGALAHVAVLVSSLPDQPLPPDSTMITRKVFDIVVANQGAVPRVPW